MAAVQNLVVQVGRPYAFLRLPAQIGHAHKKQRRRPFLLLVRLAPRHKSRTPQGNRQKSLHGLLYFRKQGIDAILHIIQLHLRLQQIIRQTKGQKGQQNILALPSVGPQFLVCKPFFHQPHGTLHPPHVGAGFEGYLKPENSKVDVFLTHKNLLNAVVLLNAVQQGVNAPERFDAQMFLPCQGIAQLAVFFFQNGLFRHNGGGFGAKTGIFRPKAVQSVQKFRNTEFKPFQKFHEV